ncbi:MAG TPA: hypothetical protein VHX43_19905 [Xanthobacteraceae bacterium]|jgi:hypothetical protein|nr:hypothetical protein [Xanthobacteraceae bacterium]
MTRQASVALVALLSFAATFGARAEMLRRFLASPLVEEGSDPDGCTPALSGFGGPPHWQVRVERYLPDGKGLIEASHIPLPNRFPLCIADQPVAKNAEVQLPFVAHDGGVAQTAGVVLRFADPQDFYVAEADALANRVRFISIVNGERREIVSRALPIALGQAHTLKVKADGETFGVALDGVPLFTAHDGGLISAGRFGVRSRADSRTVFGDLYVTVFN